jgi:hypothetical protein
MYDVASDKWINLPKMPVAASNLSSLVVDNNVYILGGKHSGAGGVDSVYHLDLGTQQWHTDPSMLEEQQRPIACSMSSNIYVVYNTYNGDPTPVSLQHYRVGSGGWSYKANLPDGLQQTNGASVLAVNDLLYLVGGAHRICGQYHTTTDTWTLLASPSLANHQFGSAVSYKGKIYLCGGVYSFTDIAEEYNIKDNKWEESALKLPIKLAQHTAAMAVLA